MTKAFLGKNVKLFDFFPLLWKKGFWTAGRAVN